MMPTRDTGRVLATLALLVVVLTGTAPASGATEAPSAGEAAVPDDAVGLDSKRDADDPLATGVPAHGALDVVDGPDGAWSVPATAIAAFDDPTPFDAPTDVTAPSLPPGVEVVVLGYTRYDDSDPLENETRRRVYEAIAGEPGTYVAAIVEATDIPRGTVRYHLRILEDERLVDVETVGGKRRYAPAGDDVHLAAALVDGPARAVLEAVARFEPVTVGGLADEVDRAPSTVSHHLDRLEADDLVDRASDGRRTLVTLGPRTRSDPGGGQGAGSGSASPGVRGK